MTRRLLIDGWQRTRPSSGHGVRLRSADFRPITPLRRVHEGASPRINETAHATSDEHNVEQHDGSEQEKPGKISLNQGFKPSTAQPTSIRYQDAGYRRPNIWFATEKQHKEAPTPPPTPAPPKAPKFTHVFATAKAQEGGQLVAEKSVRQASFSRPKQQEMGNIDKNEGQDMDEDPQEIPKLYYYLRRFAAAGKMEEVIPLVGRLVEKKKELPNMRIYSALILANVSRADGSAAAVDALLNEMKEEGFSLDSTIYHDALKVLAIHPDGMLRGQILVEMREKWFSLTASGWNDVVAGCVREGLLEQALESMDAMREAGVPIYAWLCDMTVYVLCDAGEIGEALALMKLRVYLSDQTGSASAWYYLFDAACQNLHYDALQFIWQRRVEHHHLNPTSGQCIQVLNAVARRGDVQIATDVFRVLSKRSTVFESHHYEMLIQAYTTVGDIKTALTILCIMQSAGMKPTMSATTAIALYLKQSTERPQQAFEILDELKETRPVPTEAMNRVIEACVSHGGIAQAIDMYASLHKICPDGPNVATFNALLVACRNAKRKDTAMFLASEMLELKIRPNALTYDRLILTCLQEREDYEDAFRYYGEMRASGFTPRSGTFAELIRRGCDIGDGRVWEVLETMEKLGFRDSRLSALVAEHFPDGPMRRNQYAGEVKSA